MSAHIVIINDLSEPMGGASLLALKSAIEFADRGHRVTFVTGDEGSDLLRDAGVEIVALGQQRLLAAGVAKSAVRGLYNPGARKMLERWIQANDNGRAVYHLHGWAQILSPSIFVPLRKVADRLIMSAHDFFVTCPNGAMYDFKRQKHCELKPMSTQCVMRNCDRRSYLQKGWRLARHSVLAQTRPGFDEFPPLMLIHKSMADYFAKGGVEARDMFVLPNPITPFCNSRVPAETNKAALFVGRIECTKGIDRAAEACRRAGIPLIAIGTGELLPRLRETYPEHQWLGWKPAESIGAYAAQARMLLMPSTAIEPFGLTAVEGLWSGLPVVFSDRALLAGEIEQAGAGAGVDPYDIDGFAALLKSWAGNDPLVRGLSINAIEGTRGLALSWNAWIERLQESYEAILRGGKSELANLYDSEDSEVAPITYRTSKPLREAAFRSNTDLSNAAG